MIKYHHGLQACLLAASVLVLHSCGKSDASQPMQSGILKQNMDTLVKPGDNFDAYVNGAWLKKTAIPADKSSYGAADILYDQSQEDVRAIIEAAAKSGGAEGSNEQKIGDFYASYMDQKTRDAKGISPIQPEFKAIDAIASYTDLAKFFGNANRDGNLYPFNLSVQQDFKKPTEHVLMTWQSGLGLPEREYYLLTDDKSKAIRDKYRTHVQNMLTLGQVADPAGCATKILALETQIAQAHMKKEDTRNTAALYNVYATADLKKLMPDFDWNTYLTAAGMQNEKRIVVSQVDFIKSLNSIIKNTPLDVWKVYLKWGVLHGGAKSLTAAIDQENFSFYGKTLYGIEKQREQWRRAVETVNGNLGEIVGKEYVAKHFPPEAKERMVKLVDNLLKAYAESIKTLDWMSPETKKQALEKIKKFNPKIGYPDKWRDYSALKIAKNDLYGNMQRATQFEYQRQLDKLGKPVDKDEWGMSPQTVNAYYNPSLNEIVFPAAILQPPYFNLAADDAVNYGGIGAVIGHEIGHGFDDQGANFDGDGVMRDWWTASDKQAFQQRTAALVDQYNNIKVFPDLNVNGQFTLGENIGDLGGLSIAIKAYKMSLGGKPSPKLDGFTGEQRVFLGWGQVWLSKDREESLRSQVASDPHSPANARVNGTIRNIPEFYEAFGVKPGDSLYIAPEKRVKIW
ncbi:M13 family metallopeptidase [Flavobacterium caeni]|uniref:Putative endopeptidase n=1 Tax=Flavobacterium caeni TaxID=490189 RepID=A0A1G5E5D4_9FLAO|nr:M13-type metalloendopeptidase [Flavobacterium caeni]SCY21718.1 putative endopeptidase [Flavobacterium caeni]